MPESQSSDADDNSSVSNANIANNNPIRQENQPSPPRGLMLPEHFIMKQARNEDLICTITIIGLIAASTVVFFHTGSPLSLGFLAGIPSALSIRRRKVEAIFPISEEDKQIRLKEPDMEIAKIGQQSSSVILPFLNWLKRFLGR